MLKKFVMGLSIFFIFLFLINPSANAIKFDVIKNNILDENVNQLKKNEFRDLKLIIEPIKYPHPFLFYFVMSISFFRFIRFLILFTFSTEYVQSGFWPELKIKHPLLYMHALVLFFRFQIWYFFWHSLAEKMDWNWPIFY
jgi:hypothetical protein